MRLGHRLRDILQYPAIRAAAPARTAIRRVGDVIRERELSRTNFDERTEGWAWTHTRRWRFG